MKIFIVTQTKFPEPCAVTTHISLVAKVFQEGGHTVRVFSRSNTESGEYENIPFTSLRGKGKNRLSLLFHYLFYFKKELFRILREEKPDIVLMYSLPFGVASALVSKSRHKNFLLMHDSVEWYSKEESEFLSMQRLQYYMHEYKMRKLLPGKVTIIAISQYLKDYFLSKGNDCAYLPAVCDTKITSGHKDLSQEKLTVLYAGSPGKKDLFEPIVKAMSELPAEDREKLSLQIIGSTASEIAANANVSVAFIERLGDCMTFLPRMPHAEVLKCLEKADFTILIRPAKMRYAKAGFPTKVPESLSTATPIICNLTSDLHMYLEDGENAVIAEGYSTEAVKNALHRALSLTLEQRERMCRNARDTAIQQFDYRLYVDEINDFIEHSYEKLKGCR